MDIKYKKVFMKMNERKERVEHMAVLLGVSDVTVRNKLSGVSEWNISEIRELCAHYSMTFEELFNE